MKLTFPQLDQLVNQARAQAPREACGIIGGRNGRALKLFPLPNNDLQPLVRYNAEPNALLNALREIEENGWEHIAIYHSHPASPGYPSPTDIARAFYPETAYLVISLADPEQALVRGFRIVEGEVKEITLEVEDEDES